MFNLMSARPVLNSLDYSEPKSNNNQKGKTLHCTVPCDGIDRSEICDMKIIRHKRVTHY